MHDVEFLKLGRLTLLRLEDLPNDGKGSSGLACTRHSTDVERAAAASLLNAIDDVIVNLLLLRFSAWELIRLRI